MNVTEVSTSGSPNLPVKPDAQILCIDSVLFFFFFFLFLKMVDKGLFPQLLINGRGSTFTKAGEFVK